MALAPAAVLEEELPEVQGPAAPLATREWDRAKEACRVPAAAQAMVHPLAKAPTLAQDQAAKIFNTVWKQAHPEAEGQTEAVPVVWAQAAPAAVARAVSADQVILGAAYQPGVRKTRTSWES
jgi:hypothetical protein